MSGDNPVCERENLNCDGNLLALAFRSAELVCFLFQESDYLLLICEVYADWVQSPLVACRDKRL